MVSAIVPDKPRMNNHFLLTPKKGYHLYFINIELNANETNDLASTSSCAGIS